MILVSHFDSFGTDNSNSSETIAGLLKERTNEIRVIDLPTVFLKSGDLLIEAIEETHPELIIMLGQAGGRSAVSIEKVAINSMDSRIEDNEGNRPKGIPIDKDGPAGYFSTLPIEEIVGALRESVLPGYVSFSAGSFVCNCLMYQVLNYLSSIDKPSPAGFIHIPYLAEQVIDRPGTPWVGTDYVLKTLYTVIRTSLGANV